MSCMSKHSIKIFRHALTFLTLSPDMLAAYIQISHEAVLAFAVGLRERRTL